MKVQLQQYKQLDFYRPQGSCGMVMFLHVSVILSTGGRLADPLGRPPHPWADTLPWANTPPGGRHPPSPGRPLQRVVRILLECILVFCKFVYYSIKKTVQRFCYTLQNTCRHGVSNGPSSTA